MSRHPDVLILDFGVQLAAAAAVLLKEGVERVEEGHAAWVEHALLDHLRRENEAESENDRSPIRRMGTSVEDGWRGV